MVSLLVRLRVEISFNAGANIQLKVSLLVRLRVEIVVRTLIAAR